LTRSCVFEGIIALIGTWGHWDFRALERALVGKHALQESFRGHAEQILSIAMVVLREYTDTIPIFTGATTKHLFKTDNLNEIKFNKYYGRNAT
jgi:hypothetical protein